jgi:hypothetical protein
MWESIKNCGEWIEGHKTLSLGITVGSIVVCLVGLAAIPFVLVRLPQDHFVKPDPPFLPPPGSGIGAWIWMVVRNLLGVAMLIAGLAMMFLPGPGIVGLILGLSLIQCPYKKKIESYFVRRPFVHETINNLRKKHNVPPLDLPDEQRTE